MIDIELFFNRMQKDLAIEIVGQVSNVARVSTDTRTLQEGDLFLCLVGENFNGNEFILKALESGAKGIVYSLGFYSKEEIAKLRESFQETFFIGVEDTEKTFQKLGSFHHKNWKSDERLTFALTGSNGKTTTKEILFQLLEKAYPGEVLVTQGNLNNHLGVPMTLLRLKPSHKVCILEMGTNHPGEIAFLAKLGDPDIGMITNIGQSHLEFFDSEENVFIEKSELYNYVKSKEGFFVVDGDDKFLKQLKGDDKLIKVGFSEGDKLCHLEKSTLTFESEGGLKFEAPLLFGTHNFKNLAMALSLILAYEPKLKDCLVEACRTLKLPDNNRSQVLETDNGFIFLDAYNANPSSMRASIDTFAQMVGEKDGKLEDSFAVLGDMNELGDKTDVYHAEIAKFLYKKGIVKAAFIGRFSEYYLAGYKGEARAYATVEDFQKDWKELKGTCRFFILKGSRTLQLESLVALN